MNKVIILSAGHNPQAKGAEWGMQNEYDVAQRWIQEILLYIEGHGFQVYLVSTGTLPEKVAEVNEFVSAHNLSGNSIAAELHFNAAGRQYIEGNETLYYPGSIRGRELAETYNKSFFAAAKAEVVKDRGVKEGWYKMDRPGVIDYAGDVDGNEKPDYWLRKTNCPALILEPCFLCQVGDDWVKVAHAIGRGLIAALHGNKSK